MDAPFSILRVRPASAEPEGPRHDRLIELMRMLEPDAVGEQTDVFTETIPVALDASPFDEELVARLASAMDHHLSSRAVLLIDFCYDRTIECYGFLEWLLYMALMQLSTRHQDPHTIYVFLDALPRQGERLFLLTHEDGDSRNKHIFVDRRGELLASEELSQLDQPVLEQWLTAVRNDLPRLFDRRLLRKRGIFGSSRTTVPPTVYQFRYEITNNRGSRELAELLIAYFQEHAISTVIFTESLAEAWMEPAVSYASYVVGASWSSVSSLEMNDEDLEEELRPLVRAVRDELASEASELCMVLPAFRDGNGYLRLARVAESYGRSSFKTLAIIMDQAVAERAGAAAESWFRYVDLPVGASRQRIDYLLSAPIRPVTVGTWQYEAARAAGELDYDKGHWSTELAMWGLFDDYPIDEERPVPGGREAVRWFPQLQSLEAWDATWVAWMLLEGLLGFLGCHRRELLIVMPNEANGTGPVSRALEQRLGVPVVTLARGVINGESEIVGKDRNLIADFQMLKVACIDESLVNGDTLDRLDEIVRGIRGRGSDASTVIMSAGEGPLSVTPLFSWRPFLTTTAQTS